MKLPKLAVKAQQTALDSIGLALVALGITLWSVQWGVIAFGLAFLLTSWKMSK